MPRKKCTCHLKKGSRACPNCSTYKMVFLLNHTAGHLKITDAAGNTCNPARWSFLKEEHKDPRAIFLNMLKRFQKTEEYRQSNYIQFYERGADKPLFTEKP